MGVAQINKKSMIEVYAIGGWRVINDMKNTYKEAERFVIFLSKIYLEYC